MNDNEVMIDIETFGVCNNSCIIAIAAVKFSRNVDIGNYKECVSFFRRINVDSCKAIGLTIDKDTVKWWENREEEVKRNVLEGDKVDIKSALIELQNWCKGCKYFWANSPSFDMVILENAYKECKLTPPWKYYQTRDVRTALDILGVDSRTLPNGYPHDPRYDCWRQIYGLNIGFNR
jgi:hypothetical protein